MQGNHEPATATAFITDLGSGGSAIMRDHSPEMLGHAITLYATRTLLSGAEEELAGGHPNQPAGT